MELRPQMMFVFLSVLVATTNTATGFILSSSSQCSVPRVCSCSSSKVSCISSSLTVIPKFILANSTDYISNLYIYLDSNQITSIPKNAFQNFSFVNTSNIHIQFNINKINIIDSSAFTGVENKVTTLHLANNNLSSLPAALGKLNKLQTLYLSGNPVSTLDSSILAHLGRSLTMLSLDISHFHYWPMDLNKLQLLKSLSISYISFSHLPLNAFFGMESSLTTLAMTHSQLDSIPVAICHLHNLQSFSFDSNSVLQSNFSLFEPCSHKLTQLTLLSLRNDNLYAFPDVLHAFPSLTSLYLEDNKIRFIHTNIIPYNSGLQTLYLSHNQLTRIPFALNKLKSLSTLNLGSNEITTVEDHDLVGLSKLGTLYLNNNPIEYVAPHAFKNNGQVTYLNLEHTNLFLILDAVRSLYRLNTLYFRYNNADCSCRMSYLKGWNVTTVTYFYGNCASQPSDPIKQYMLTSLSNCP